jgi:hypothetical protein
VKGLPVALVLLIGVVAWDWGGYDPWALLILELGSALLVLALVSRDAWEPPEETEVIRSRFDAWRRLPFWVRHMELASVVGVFTLGVFPRRKSSPEVEILLPGSGERASVELDLAREGFLFGRPIKRTGLLAPLVLLTIWVALSLVPLSRPVLSGLSPEAASLRAEAERLLGSEPSAAPWSLAPYQSLRGLWIWLAVAGVFYTSFRCARAPGRALRLSLGLLLLGAGSGVLGVAGFFSELQSAEVARRGCAHRELGQHYRRVSGMLL